MIIIILSLSCNIQALMQGVMKVLLVDHLPMIATR